MAQRNPMNDRYQGDGPQGKTRKSAAKLKPKTEAAASVHIEKKPQTKQERKAARKKRDAQLAKKEAERKRKAEEREKQARIDAGEEPAEPQKATMGSKIKNIFIGPPKNDASSAAKASSAQSAQQTPQQTRAMSKGPDTPEYKKLKRIYWVLMGVGIVAIAISFLINFTAPEFMDGWGMMLPMGVAYIAVIGAIILDYSKIRKMQREHNKQVVGGKMSPKQLKHEQQKAEAAALLEEQKKAQKEQKRANSKLPFIKKTTAATTEEESPATSDESEEVSETVESADTLDEVTATTIDEETSSASDKVEE